VTTVVLMAPLSLFVAGILGVSPVPFLVSLIFASNIGGTATLIGDPPNILIGSAAGLSFVDFIVHLTPIILIVLAVFFAGSFGFFRSRMRPVAEYQRRVMGLDEGEVLGDRRLLYLSLGILGLVILGFLLHGTLELEPATVALGGATALIVVGGIHPRDAFLEVEWPTIFFFVGLFMVVGGVEEAGLLEDIGQSMSDASGGHLWAGTMLVLWSGALLSGIVDNIPFTAAMIPVVRELGQDLGVQESAGNPLWWALALGAGLGGNLTLVAASANVYVAGVAERAGYKISFLEFMKWGGLMTLASLVMATVYLWLRYLL